MLSIPYYYNSFSCFFTKIFRMTSFAPREAMTTAEQTEPFVSLAINVLFHHESLSDLVGPSARLSVYSVDCKKIVYIRVHSWLIINEL